MSKKETAKIVKKTDEKEALIISASKGSAHAVRESKALGLTVKLITNHNLIEKLPSGKINVLRKISNVSVTKRELKKGTVLSRK